MLHQNLFYDFRLDTYKRHYLSRILHCFNECKQGNTSDLWWESYSIQQLVHLLGTKVLPQINMFCIYKIITFISLNIIFIIRFLQQILYIICLSNNISCEQAVWQSFLVLVLTGIWPDLLKYQFSSFYTTKWLNFRKNILSTPPSD